MALFEKWELSSNMQGYFSAFIGIMGKLLPEAQHKIQLSTTSEHSGRALGTNVHLEHACLGMYSL